VVVLGVAATPGLRANASISDNVTNTSISFSLYLGYSLPRNIQGFGHFVLGHALVPQLHHLGRVSFALWPWFSRHRWLGLQA
jgi:hypothetical protein